MKKELSKEQREQILRLRKIREDLKVSQEQFADILDISTSAYKKIEAFERQISLSVLKKLHAKLGISVDHLLYGNKEDSDELWKAILNCSEKDKMILFLKLYHYFAYTRNEIYPLPGNEVHNIEEILRRMDDMQNPE